MTVEKKQRVNKPPKKVFIAATLLLCLVAFLIYTKDLSQLELLYCTSDEMGYLGTAAYFAGVDWTGVVSRLYYYSYGYSLLLTPLFSLFKDPATLYQTAIALNAVMMAATIPLSVAVAKRLFPCVNRWLMLGVCFCVSLYSAGMLQVTMARNESLLFLLVWVLLLLFLLIKDGRSRIWPVALIAALSFYSFMVHQRAIAIVLASVLVVCLMFATKQINVRSFISFWVVLALMLCLHLWLKGYVQNRVWTGPAIPGNNDFSGASTKLKLLFTQEGAGNFLKGLLGQFFYLGVASFLLYYTGVVQMLKGAWQRLRSVFSKSKSDGQEGNTWGLLFLAVAVVLTWLLSALFLIKLVRMDHVLYGRYNDIFVGPVLLVALFYLLNRKHSMAKPAMINIAVFSVLGIVSYFSVQGLPNFSIISSPAMAWLEPFFQQHWYVVILLPIIIYVGILCLSWPNKKYAMARSAGVLGLTGALFVYAGLYPIHTTMLPAQRQNQLSTQPPLQYVTAQPDQPVYGFAEGEDAWQFSYLQFALGKRSIAMLDQADDIAHLPAGSTVITTASGLFIPPLRQQAQIVQSSDKYIVWQTQDAPTSDSSITIPLPLFSSQSGHCTPTGIRTDSSDGYLLYGPYMTMPAGTYTAVIHLDAVSPVDPGTVIGMADVSVLTQPIVTADVTAQASEIRLPFELYTETEMVEIRLALEPGYTATVQLVQLEQIG